MKVIGITGGVGSGKSCILELLKEEYRALVIQADDVAKELMEPGEQGFVKLTEALGTGILTEEGRINRPVLSELLFHDKTVIQIVNNIIHPLVWQEIRSRIAGSQMSLTVVEAALADENHRDIYDELWYVYTSEESRMERLSKSRGYTAEKTRSMMANQPSEERFRSLANYIIDNNGSLEETRQQLCFILKDKGKAE